MTHGKNTGLVLAGLLMAALGSFGCPEVRDVLEDVVKPPSIQVRDIVVTGISSKNLDLDLGVDIFNDNPIGLTLSGIDYDLKLAGTPLASGNSGAGIELVASGKSTARIPISVAYNQIGKIYSAAKGADEIPYQLSGKVSINTPIGDIPIPFSTSGMMPVIRPPRIKDVRIERKKISLSGADLVIVIKLMNPNSFTLDINAINYSLALDNKNFSSGQVGSQSVRAKSSGSIRIPVSIDFAGAGSWAYSLLRKGSVPYSLNYNATYQLANHPVNQNEQVNGVIKFR